jgi:hypothetical protein
VNKEKEFNQKQNILNDLIFKKKWINWKRK